MNINSIFKRKHKYLVTFYKPSRVRKNTYVQGLLGAHYNLLSRSPLNMEYLQSKD